MPAGHAGALKVDDVGNAGLHHDVLALEVAMNDHRQEGTDGLREKVEILIEGLPVGDLRLSQTGDESFEEVRSFPAQVIVIEHP